MLEKRAYKRPIEEKTEIGSTHTVERDRRGQRPRILTVAGRDRISLPQFENLRALCGLAEKSANQTACHNLGARAPNKERKKFLVGSGGSLRPAEYPGFAPYGELKKLIPLTCKDAGR
jgi:hypothetical protein